MVESDSYLNGGWFGEANSLDILHDLWITLVGLQKSSTGVGNRTLLSFSEVVNKDIVVLLPGTRKNMVWIVASGHLHSVGAVFVLFFLF